jgi:AcrR family transcriptional regulator
VLEATSRLLEDVGYERLSVEEVAARAGVHKTTVYRRWPTKASLVLDATRVHSAEAIPIPDTGNLAGDLKSLARDVAANIGSDPGARRSLSIVAAAAASEDLTTALHTFWAERLALTVPIVDRAIERGELPPSSDANLIVEAVIGPIWIRLLLTGEVIDDNLADRIAELVVAGARSQA